MKKTLTYSAHCTILFPSSATKQMRKNKLLEEPNHEEEQEGLYPG
jgi:hypothetical protein